MNILASQPEAQLHNPFIKLIELGLQQGLLARDKTATDEERMLLMRMLNVCIFLRSTSCHAITAEDVIRGLVAFLNGLIDLISDDTDVIIQEMRLYLNGFDAAMDCVTDSQRRKNLLLAVSAMPKGFLDREI